jgi:hypothetical protein
VVLYTTSINNLHFGFLKVSAFPTNASALSVRFRHQYERVYLAVDLHGLGEGQLAGVLFPDLVIDDVLQCLGLPGDRAGIIEAILLLQESGMQLRPLDAELAWCTHHVIRHLVEVVEVIDRQLFVTRVRTF